KDNNNSSSRVSSSRPVSALAHAVSRRLHQRNTLCGAGSLQPVSPKGGLGDDRRDHAIDFRPREAVAANAPSNQHLGQAQPAPERPVVRADRLDRSLRIELIDPKRSTRLERRPSGIQTGNRFLPVVERKQRQRKVERISKPRLLDLALTKLEI